MCVVLPCREINIKNMSFYVIFAGFKSFLLIFKVILLIFFTIFLGHQNPGPADYIRKVSLSMSYVSISPLLIGLWADPEP